MTLYNKFNAVIQSFGMQYLAHPLFYNSKVAIRFNIGDNGIQRYLEKDKQNAVVNPKYITACLDRVKQIYNSLSAPPDILVIDGFLDERETIEDFINNITSSTNLIQPKEIKSETVFEEDDELTHVFLLWELNELNPDKLLREIISADLGGNYRLVSSVYFVCSCDKVLFHLYDDRGADLCSEKTSSIMHIYKGLNNLILDYDKKRIEAIFKAE